jgi:phosphodiesterase/alkaline phosphatase D-like protein
MVRYLVCLIFLLGSLAMGQTNIIQLAQGLMSGEVTATSAILKSRLTAVAAITDGKVPGQVGVGRFEISTDPTYKHSHFTPWLNATEGNDFILRAAVEKIEPSLTYSSNSTLLPDPTRKPVSVSGARPFL